MESVLGQTLTEWELIICDSFSDDGSWEFLQKFGNDRRVRLYQVPRDGLYAGWNECLRRTTGKYICIATSDDTCAPDFLDKMVGALDRTPSISLAVCDFQTVDSAGRNLSVPGDEKRRQFFGRWMQTPSIRNGKTEFLLHTCFRNVWVTMTSVLFRREFLETTGLFQANVGPVADVGWCMRASLASDVAFVPERLTTWRMHEKQATAMMPSNTALRHVLDQLESIVRESPSRIPEDWKRVPDWKRKLMEVIYLEYLDSFGLYAGRIRESVRDSSVRAIRAIRSEPAFFVSQLLKGFSWSNEFSPAPGRKAMELIDAFHASWPPKETARWELGQGLGERN